MKKFALLSVSNKLKLRELANALISGGYKIIATGNTAKLLFSANIEVIEISSLTGFPEILDGRVKTLHPKIFGGVLYRRDNKNDQHQVKQFDINPIDIVCVNLYPFVETIKKPNVTLEECIENIDIGGPSLIRAAAKNHQYVSVLTNPDQYDSFIEELKMGEVSLETKRVLAVEAYSHTANYDTHIANFLENKFELPKSYFRINYKKDKDLRYGENPHQKAAIFGDFKSYFDVFHGKEISYNNILDLIAAIELTEDLGRNSCAIIKHNNPAGAAIGNNALDAYIKALKCDPVSAFGGIVVTSFVIEETLAEKLNEIFLEIVCAPEFTEGAISILLKKKDRRLIKQLKPLSHSPSQMNYKNIPGGVLAQDSDNISLIDNKLKTVTDVKPTAKQMEDLKFAWIVSKHTKSNAIVFAKDKTTLAVGAGQMSRLDSVKIAVMKAKEHGLELRDSVAASDAFFPFADGLLEIIKCGAVSVIQPGGSVRDKEVIDAANRNKISMVFTGLRHFKH